MAMQSVSHLAAKGRTETPLSISRRPPSPHPTSPDRLRPGGSAPAFTEAYPVLARRQSGASTESRWFTFAKVPEYQFFIVVSCVAQASAGLLIVVNGIRGTNGIRNL
eukprot:501594-Amorphochlora_amoeboformis.AAC.1